MAPDNLGGLHFQILPNQFQQYCQVSICTVIQTVIDDCLSFSDLYACTYMYILNSNKLSFSFADELVPLGNPFKMPADSDIFVLRDKERQRKKLVRNKIKIKI